MNNLIDFFNNLNSEIITDLLIAIIIMVVFFTLSSMFAYMIIKIFNIRKSKKKIKQNSFYLPLKFFFKALGIYLALIFLKPVLGYNDNISNIITSTFKLIIILNTAIGLARSITENSSFLKKLKEKSERDLDDSTLVTIIKVIRACIYIIAGFLIFYELGYDLSGLITGLGLSSIVITIAAQDTIKNLFGGVIIFFDKPFKIGDYINFGDYEGTVEDITWRSTKLRTIESAVAQIPNSIITASTVINLSKIQKRRFITDLGISLNTSINEIENLKKQILEYLNNNVNVINGSTNIFFEEIRTYDFRLNVSCYINIIEYQEFMQIKEKLNYEIVKIINNNNITLA